MFRQITIIVVLCCSTLQINAQVNCGKGDLENKISTSCSLNDKQVYEAGWISYFNSPPPNNSTYHIPLIFHVLEGTNSSQITDQQIIDGIEQANIHFSQYYNGIEGEQNQINIEFYLVSFDSNESCFNGIIRHDIGDAIYDFTEPGWRGQFQINPKKYCNVYVAESSNSTSAVGAASMGPYWVDCLPDEDGVAVQYDGIGNGATSFSHELGHYLGLFHLGEVTPILEGGNSNPCWDCEGFFDEDDEENIKCLQRGDRICDTDPVWLQFALNASSCEPIIDQCAI